MVKRRSISPFSLSFLDIMFCGFGAVVLLVLIINTDMLHARGEAFADLRSEVVRIENEVIIGRENLVEIQNSLDVTNMDLVMTQGESRLVLESMQTIESGLIDMQHETDASREHINGLKSDLIQLDEEYQLLDSEIASRPTPGEKVHHFSGEGDRQYLTGLKLGGKRVLILLDSSSSMLDETVVNIIRLRNMGDSVKQGAVKWKRGQRTVEWLISNLQENVKFQVYLFNTSSRAALPSSEGKWLSTSNPMEIDGAIIGLREAIPSGGTSLYNAFNTATQLKPEPDNILVVTDGLPTQGKSKPSSTTVTADKRLDHFIRATKILPEGIPINTILLPMEGDAWAAAAFWKLAVDTQGSFLSPARDWP
jgi:hypothetical protein